MFNRIFYFNLAICISLGFSSAGLALQDHQSVDFSRDIRPILADTCFKCHGPDEQERKAGLRLDSKAAVFEEFETVVPGDLDASELYQRIISDDSEMLMPPPDSGRVLSDEQKDLLKGWIEQGADWEEHWSFIKPVAGEPPVVNQSDWPTNTIDKYILSRLEQENLTPSQSAERLTLIRRVAFDLTGLPPSQELLAKYADDENQKWYEQLVNELLESEQYGEHMARFWLDAARYGDTHGLHLDNYREMWPYRDWVIGAFNRNLSYKDFIIQQLAGDMLENPTDDQKIASGFNRAHITTSEGGSIEEEVYIRNVIDRTSTAGTVFLGLSVGCAQCHDHKFDPISQKEFYQLFAFFNNMTDPPMDQNIKAPPPVMMVANDAQRAEQKRMQIAVDQANAAMKKLITEFEYVDDDPDYGTSEPASVTTDSVAETVPATEKFVWIDDRLPVGAKQQETWNFVTTENGRVHTGEKSRVVDLKDEFRQHFFTDALAPLRVQAGDTLFANVYLDPENPPAEIMLQFNDGDWNHRMFWGADKINFGETGTPSRLFGGELPETGKWIQLEVPVEQVGFKDLSSINGIAFSQQGGKAYWDSAGVYSSLKQTGEFTSLAHWLHLVRNTKGNGLPDPIKKIVNEAPGQVGEQQQQTIRDYFLQEIYPESRQVFADAIKQRDASMKQLTEFEKNLPTTLVSQENESIKAAYVLKRGEYDQKGDQVERKTPAALPPFADDLPVTRLGLALWLVNPDQPLTARVTVNRFWQQIFGTGIVKTSEDFGAQGDVPSHPKLLDWLASDFVAYDWDVKRLMKMMVMSSTYRQSSVITPTLWAKDPNNRLLARGPRFRLDAEALRDQALAVSGLLVEKIGGPSVKPPQPDGLWFAVGYSGSNTVRFKKDEGHEKVHRRSLYTFWKRTSSPPEMNTFDAPSRESCTVRRERTNTPLQALMLMNDPQYVEAARFLAQRTIDSESDEDARFAWMFETALGRPGNPAELEMLKQQWQSDFEEFKNQSDSAQALIAIGETPADSKYEVSELAAWTMTASLVMNMDEFVSKN